PRSGSFVSFKNVLRDQSPTDEGFSPERRRPLELDADRVVVDLDRADVLVTAGARRRGSRIGGVLPVEDAIVSGEWLTVVPFDAPFQLPGDRQTILGEAAVLDARDRGGEHRRQVAVRIPTGQRLVEHARAVLVLDTDGEVRGQQRRGPPPQKP